MTDLISLFRDLGWLDRIALGGTILGVSMLIFGSATWLLEHLWHGARELVADLRRYLVQREIDAWTRTYCPDCGEYRMTLASNRCTRCHGPLEHVSAEDFPAHVARTWKDPAAKGFRKPDPAVMVDQVGSDRRARIQALQTRRPS